MNQVKTATHYLTWIQIFIQ